MEKNRVAILILNWNGLNDTLLCVRSLQTHQLPADIYVLDNGSNHNEADLLKVQLSDCFISRSSSNLGFTGGNNQLLQAVQSQYDYCVLLNQDTITTADWLTPMVAYMDDHSEVAVTGPTGASISLWTGKVTNLELLTPTRVDCVVGYCFMIRSKILPKVGYLTKRYFAYYEEADWCVQARQQGFDVLAIPTKAIEHRRHHQFRTYYISRNMVWFMKRFANPLQLTFFFCYYFSIYWLERLRKGSRFSDLLKAAKDGWL